MGNDGGYTGTRNGRCSLPTSSRLGSGGLLSCRREEEGTVYMPLPVKNNIFKGIGNDSGYTGTRNGPCSLLTSSRVGDVGVLSSGMEEEGTAPLPLLVKNNRFEGMGDDGGYTGTRNGRCSLLSSSCLGDVGLLASGRDEEGTAPMLILVKNN